MATVTKPIALDESFNTTETPSRNIADVLASLGDAISQGAQPVTKKLATNSFKTINGGLVDGLTVQFAPVQDLHGQSKPWAGGAGKNQLPMTVAYLKTANTTGTWSDNVYTIRGCAFTVNTDSDGNVISITANRVSADANNPVFYVMKESYVVSESMTLNGCPSGGSSSTYRLRTTEGDNCFGGDTTIAPQTLTGVYIRIESAYDVQNVTFTPMLRLASIADPTFEPYSNICPISGHTEAKAKINDTVYTTSLGGTEYGGEVELVSGEGEVVQKTVTFDGSVDENIVSLDSPKRYGIDIPNDSITMSSAPQQLNGFICNEFAEITDEQGRNGIVGFHLRNNGSHSILVCMGANAPATIADFRTWLGNNNLQLVYKLATPTTLTLTSQSITAEVGENNVSAPLDGQSIKTDSVIYKDMFTWEDVLKVI